MYYQVLLSVYVHKAPLGQIVHPVWALIPLIASGVSMKLVAGHSPIARARIGSLPRSIVRLVLDFEFYAHLLKDVITTTRAMIALTTTIDVIGAWTLTNASVNTREAATMSSTRNLFAVFLNTLSIFSKSVQNKTLLDDYLNPKHPIFLVPNI
jgi:hypothetical protein